MKNKIYVVLVMLFILTGCQHDKNDNIITIKSTVGPLTQIVKLVGGEKVDVQSVYPDGVDPHSYEISGNNLLSISNADLVFYISDNYETWVKALDEQNASETKFINITEHTNFKKNVDNILYSSDKESSIEESDNHNHQTTGGIIDPHVWISPSKLMIISTIVTEELCEYDTTNCDTYRNNSQELLNELSIIDKEYESLEKTFDKTIIVAHDAYSYLETDYGFKIKSMYGKSHDDEPTASDIKETIDLINKTNISKIYTEQNDENNDVINQISIETGADILTLNNLSTISKDIDFLLELKNNLEILKGI